MAAPHVRLMDVSAAGFTPRRAGRGPDRTPRQTLSEFERAQVCRIAAEGAALAADVVRWHSDSKDAFHGDLELHLSHGLGVAALGALVMEILAWTRLLEPPDVPPTTLRTAREVIESQDPTVDPSVLDYHARAMLQQALTIKAKARQVSRLW
ncbi:hypothetical protein [Paramagnetospirillum magneticum]|nr:hypothetical protein [Paramagnetospirillum magneticum]